MIFFLAFPLTALGCAAFVICSFAPPLRRFALSFITLVCSLFPVLSCSSCGVSSQ